MKIGRPLLAALALLPALQAPAAADAADPVVAHAPDAGRVYRLGGVTLYQNGDPAPRHEFTPGEWVRVVGRRSRAARHMPGGAVPGDIGRDARGRVVLTFSVDTREGGRRWSVYDVKRDRARPIKGVRAGGCDVPLVTTWRARTAYVKRCSSEAASGVFVRTGTRVRRVAPQYSVVDLVQRGGSAAGIVEDGVGDLHLFRFMDGGRPCAREVAGGFGTGDGPWHPTGVWYSGSKIVWSMGSSRAAPVFALLAARRSGSCRSLGPVGELPFARRQQSVRTFTVNADRLVYASGSRIRARRLPRKPSVEPPPNDDFEHAQVLTGRLPLRVAARFGSATRQPGEPAVRGPYDSAPRSPRRTIWFAYRPASSGTVWVSTDNPYGSGPVTYGVFTGPRLGDLTLIPAGARGTEVHAEAGKTYWIAAASDSPEPDWGPPFYVVVGTAEPPPQ